MADNHPADPGLGWYDISEGGIKSGPVVETDPLADFVPRGNSAVVRFLVARLHFQSREEQ